MKKMYETPVIESFGLCGDALLSSLDFNQGSFVNDNFTENTDL